MDLYNIRAEDRDYYTARAVESHAREILVIADGHSWYSTESDDDLIPADAKAIVERLGLNGRLMAEPDAAWAVEWYRRIARSWEDSHVEDVADSLEQSGTILLQCAIYLQQYLTVQARCAFLLSLIYNAGKRA